MKNNNDLGLLIIRLTVGVLMLLHGLAKLSGVGFIEGMLAAKGLPSFIAYGVYVGEIVAPLLLIVGYRTKLAAMVFAFNTLVAMLLVHAGEIFTLTKHGGWGVELLGLYMFAAIALIFTGGGKYAISSGTKWD